METEERKAQVLDYPHYMVSARQRAMWLILGDKIASYTHMKTRQACLPWYLGTTSKN